MKLNVPKRVKYRGIWRGRHVEPIAIGGIGRSYIAAEQEAFTGMIGDVKASVPEERFARALDRLGISYQFRLALGGARNAPGFFELDFLFPRAGIYFAVEIDSLFSHMDKKYKDALHDAMVLKELDYLGLFPRVFHFDQDRDLSSQEIADKTARTYFS